MLHPAFFTFSDLQTNENIVKTNIQLNADHDIFKGHFPGQPVLPGVCMMQMVKEVAEAYILKETQLLKADDLKFLAFINPDEQKTIQMELKVNSETEIVKVEARLLDDATTLFKFKGTFVAS